MQQRVLYILAQHSFIEQALLERRHHEIVRGT
jgi:hypothetical protein